MAVYVKGYFAQSECMLNEELLSVIVSAIKVYQTELNEYILTLAENGDAKSIFELGRDLENYSLELDYCNFIQIDTLNLYCIGLIGRDYRRER